MPPIWAYPPAAFFQEDYVRLVADFDKGS